MTRLAIKGHLTRGKEVIEILEMLGGKNAYNFIGACNVPEFAYSINEQEIIDLSIHYPNSYYTIFTLEEFLEQYPYKVGDKVWLHYENTNIRVTETITRMYWCDKWNYVLYDVVTCGKLRESVFTPYKEETMESKPNLLQQLKKYFDNTPRDILEKEWNELSYLNEIGPSIDEYLECVKKYRQSNQYPKTYEECCKTLNIPSNGNIAYVGNWVYGGEYLEKHLDRLRKFQQLLICRDAYWKIAGEQMGLGKPWHQDYNDRCFIIANNKDNVHTYEYHGNDNVILSFPTEDMRDTFYENFKELIESCKELL